ncbi:MAG: tail fiber domain-containing protein [Bacteroidota bacterium]
MKLLLQLFVLLLYSHVLSGQSVGIATTTPNQNAILHIEVANNFTKGFLITGTNDLTNANNTVPNLGSGNRLMFYPGKFAFRAGRAILDAWDNVNVGRGSVAMGFNPIAKGNYSVAFGDHTVASLTGAVAMGVNTSATGSVSTAFGYLNVAGGSYSTALGYSNTAKGYASTVVGAYNDSILAVSQTDFTPETPLFTIGNGSFANRSNAMVVLYNGNVGIGTNTPVNKLQLQGNMSVSGNVGIGTNSPVNKLQVVGNMSASGNVGIGTNFPSTKLHLEGIMYVNGSVGIGTSTPAEKLHVVGNVFANNILLAYSPNPSLQFQYNGDDKAFVQLSDNQHLRIGVNGSNPAGTVIFRLNTGDRFTIFPTGNATLTGTLTQNSDERFKQDINLIDNALEKVMQLNGYEYYWKPELQKDSAMQIGLIAQNVEKVLPQLVVTDKEGSKSVAYQNMVPVLIEAIKELQQQVEILKRQAKQKND